MVKDSFQKTANDLSRAAVNSKRMSRPTFQGDQVLSNGVRYHHTHHTYKGDYDKHHFKHCVDVLMQAPRNA